MAEARIELEVVTPAKRVLSQAVDEVIVPGWDGLFGVRPGHTPFLARMRAGELEAKAGDETLLFAVGEGFVEVAMDRVTVLAATAERADEIDVERAEAEIRSEGDELRKSAVDTFEYDQHRARVERASVRVAVARKRR